MPRSVTAARVVPWEPGHPKLTWGVGVRYDDGTMEAYPVGDREAAEAEVARLTRAVVKLRVV